MLCGEKTNNKESESCMLGICHAQHLNSWFPKKLHNFKNFENTISAKLFALVAINDRFQHEQKHSKKKGSNESGQQLSLPCV